MFEANIVACATCVFQSLSHTSGAALDQALAVINTASAVNSRSVQSALYERAKLFFEQYPLPKIAEIQHGDGESDGQSKHVSGGLESFSSQLIDILVGPSMGREEVESARIKRAGLAAAYFDSTVASETGRQSLGKTLQVWLDSERSGPVREAVKRALERARA